MCPRHGIALVQRGIKRVRMVCPRCAAVYQERNKQKNPLHHKQQRKKHDATSYRKNFKKHIARACRWRELNPEKAKAYAKLYSPIRNARRRTLESIAGPKFTVSDVRSILDRQHFKCTYCATSLKSEFHIDHIHPLSKGGSNLAANLQALCPKCNQGKSSMDPIRFANRIGLLL